MIPRADMVAGGTVMALAGQVIPALPAGSYGQGTAAAAAGLLVFLAQDLDRGAQRRMEEIARMQALFAQALVGEVRLDLELRAALQAASVRPPPSDLSLSALDLERAALLPLLIRLHEAAEDSPRPPARALEQEILRHLKATADARALVIPPQ
jgi:hypothetical protein